MWLPMINVTQSSWRSVVSSYIEQVRPGVEYEVERVRIPHTWSRNAVRRLLTDRAEYGGWEMVRLRCYRDGTRDVWVRRKIIRVRQTLT